MLKLISPAFAKRALPASTDDVPPVETRQGRLAAINALTEDVVELVIEPASPCQVLPGQHMDIAFAGFPARAFCPTPALDARPADGMLSFHVSRLAAGRVSSELSRAIKVGHSVKLTGPHGDAYLRPGLQNRLVLVSSGTGFAPMWAVADAALRERPNRSMLLIVGVRSVHALYMVQALDMMATCPNVRILVISEEKQLLTRYILPGRPTDYMPPVLPRDTVFAAGPAPMLALIAETAAASGATLHATPFLPADDSKSATWFSRIAWRRGKAAPEMQDASPAMPTPPTLAARLQTATRVGPPPLKITPGLASR